MDHNNRKKRKRNSRFPEGKIPKKKKKKNITMPRKRKKGKEKKFENDKSVT